jgi:hypothetical protein
MTETAPIVPPKPSRIRRIGCTIAVILWFLLLLTPCLVIVLATHGEISVSTGSAPEQRTRIWLIMEARSRGLGVSTASAHESDGQTCVQTDVQFWLWQGSEEPTSYCECYTHQGDTYTFSGSTQGQCAAP